MLRRLHRNQKHEAVVAARVHDAIARGLLIPEPCEICGAVPAEAHHQNYLAPYNVRWLCRSHHLLLHNGHFVLLARPPRESLRWRQYGEYLEGRPLATSDPPLLSNGIPAPPLTGMIEMRMERTAKRATATRELSLLMDAAPLTCREREIIQMHYGIGGASAHILEDLARIFKVSRERVRQVEMLGLEKLRRTAAASPFAREDIGAAESLNGRLHPKPFEMGGPAPPGGADGLNTSVRAATIGRVCGPPPIRTPAASERTD